MRLRAAFGILAVLGFALAVWLAGLRSWQFWLFALGPDVALLAGIGIGLRPGQLHPRAVALYNAVHLLTGPALLAAVSPWLGRPWLGAAFAWAAHIWMDRSLGFGLRDRAGFVRQGGVQGPRANRWSGVHAPRRGNDRGRLDDPPGRF